MGENYWTERRLKRRHAIGGAAVSGLTIAVLGGLACSSSNTKKSAPSAGGGTAPVSGGASPAAAAATTGPAGSPQAGLLPTGLKPDQIRSMTKEQLRERFHGKQLKNLPGWKQGPRTGGTLIGSTTPGNVTDTPPSWDPTGPQGANLADLRAAHDQLVEWDDHELADNPNFPKLAGELAALPEQPDPLTYTFKLRPGVKFQDVAPVSGRPLVANDVKVSTEALQKAPGQGAYYADVDSIQAIDDATVQFKMKRPASYLLEQMASNENWIFAPEQMANDGLAKRPIGTGPFLFVSGEPGKGHKWARNPNYWKTDHWTGKKLPYLDGIEIRTFGDPAAVRAAFVSGQVHHTGAALQRPEDMALMAQDKPDTVFYIFQPWSAYNPHLAMRLDQPPWNDERVRQALSLTIDRDTIIKSAFGGLAEYGYGLSYAWFGREFSWNKDELQPYITYDPAKAKQLMTAAGYPNGIGRTIELLTPFNTGGYFDTYTLVADNWKKTLGLDVKLNVTPDQPTFFKSFYGKTFKDLAGGGFGIGFTDVEPDYFIYAASYSQSKANYYFVNDPQLDQWAVQQRRTLDRAERQKIVLQWKERDLNQVTRLFTVSQYFPVVRAANYYGVIANTVGANPFGWGSHLSRTHWLLS